MFNEPDVLNFALCRRKSSNMTPLSGSNCAMQNRMYGIKYIRIRVFVKFSHKCQRYNFFLFWSLHTYFITFLGRQMCELFEVYKTQNDVRVFGFALKCAHFYQNI
jgi:hypothetical protein